MPGETKIFKNTSGWYNVEKPGVYHPTRDAARAARKATITNTYKVSHRTPVVIPDGAQVPTFSGRDQRIQSPSFAGVPLSALTSLQARLFDRLTQQQGVDSPDALFVVTTNGYNAAASYGHMREAGATHVEAWQVITLGSPTASLSYGLSRGRGLDHLTALAEARSDLDDDPYDIGD